MNNDYKCCSQGVPVPCSYDIAFLAKAMAERTTVIIENVTGVIDGLERSPCGKIKIRFEYPKMPLIVNAR
jgi:hypothetical protein